MSLRSFSSTLYWACCILFFSPYHLAVCPFLNKLRKKLFCFLILWYKVGWSRKMEKIIADKCSCQTYKKNATIWPSVPHGFTSLLVQTPGEWQRSFHCPSKNKYTVNPASYWYEQPIHLCSNKLEPKKQWCGSFHRGVWTPQYLPRLLNPSLITQTKVIKCPDPTWEGKLFLFHESRTT